MFCTSLSHRHFPKERVQVFKINPTRSKPSGTCQNHLKPHPFPKYVQGPAKFQLLSVHIWGCNASTFHPNEHQMPSPWKATSNCSPSEKVLHPFSVSSSVKLFLVYLFYTLRHLHYRILTCNFHILHPQEVIRKRSFYPCLHAIIQHGAGTQNSQIFECMVIKH